MVHRQKPASSDHAVAAPRTRYAEQVGGRNSTAHGPGDLSILIVNWHSYRLLDDCLRSIVETVARPYEVIVVDNSQDARAREEVERRTGPNVKWLTNQSNRGFAAANNQAIALAKGDLVLLLNPDTVVLPDSVDRMADAMEAQPQVGVL